MILIELETEKNPLIISDNITYVISDGLREGSVNLYSAFLLNHECIRIKRFGYHQTAWNYSLSISGIVTIYMHYLCAHAFGTSKIADVVLRWLAEDLPMLKESRNHYIIDEMQKGIEPNPSKKWLEKLSEVRTNYDNLSDDHGPYHNEVFPFDYAAPEDVLLGDSNSGEFSDKQIILDIEELLINISISDWG